jgi:putative transposase
LELCQVFHVTRSAYYHWLKGDKSPSQRENERLARKVIKIHEKHPDKGYRRIRDDLNSRYHEHVNDKRILRIDRKLHIQANIKHRYNCCTRQASDPAYTTENILNRQFHADAPNEKWLTDVTEFKYYIGPVIHKLYLSAILDLYDRRIVSYVLSAHNNNGLVFDTFDEAVKSNPQAHPLFHSDRGFQYTNRSFHNRLIEHKMTQSMSRVAHCIDNGPMEGFWGILKREMYYGYKFTSKQDLMNAISSYIHYYNFERLQRRLNVMTPYEYYKHYNVA